MTIKASLALLALAFGAVPVSAQVSTRERVRDRVIYDDGTADRRTGTGGGIGDIIYGRTTTSTATRSKIPKGQLPPRGMCRVWIDGVPSGQQPPVTSCAQAERDRLRYSNARVVYGDQQSFPGKGKFKPLRDDGQLSRQCLVLDVVVIGGQQRQICRDGNVISDRNGNVIDRNGNVVRSDKVRGDDDEEDDDDRGEDRVASAGNLGENHVRAGKAHGKAKHGDE